MATKNAFMHTPCSLNSKRFRRSGISCFFKPVTEEAFCERGELASGTVFLTSQLSRVQVKSPVRPNSLEWVKCILVMIRLAVLRSSPDSCQRRMEFDSSSVRQLSLTVRVRRSSILLNRVPWFVENVLKLVVTVLCVHWSANNWNTVHELPNLVYSALLYVR